MCIRPRIGQEHFGERIWARCERHPGPVQGGPLRLSSASPPALDTIKLSFDRPKLKHESDQVIMESAFQESSGPPCRRSPSNNSFCFSHLRRGIP
ncbi:hypothetical protein BS47DRAFT_1128224 [Hydnum rufescens UP504]|uniref:Uncharacterized protein n=1 Tax=Hydnum rufescens UP504 TaxID=1448309 RepID=A0A9P6AU32_9AGAM|nr:hypothetical protein BS47DRAFT_1128224 [Hydnum rufescens UP504]